MTTLTRRGFLAATAAFAALPLVPARARAAADTFSLTATTRVIEVNGRAATVMGLLDAQGRPGLRLDPGQRFRTDLTNALDIDTIVHWHGQIPPNAQDGVPNTNPMLKPGQSRSFDFAARPGTFWMHSHIPEQEIGLLAAPLIVRRPEEVAEDRQEVVMLLHDFAFATPQEVLETVTGGTAMDHDAMDHSAAPMPGMQGMGDMMSMPGMAEMHASMEGGMSMDLNDYEFDAYLANDRTLVDPEVVRVEKGGRVRLRVIDGAAMTAFWIDTGAATARLVAVDGNPVVPLPGTRFAISPGQRLDIEIDLSGDGTAVPILALREGTRERTGLILAPKGAAVPKLADLSENPHPAVSGDMTQEIVLRAVTPLAARPATAQPMVMLMGSMLPYQWTIDGRSWENRRPVEAKSGERVEMMFHNMSMMAHPMHLHGHTFQVIEVNGTRFAGAVRDTVSVPPMGSVTVALDAGEAAPWMLHCHHMGHLATGMMTEFLVRA
ncbi:FtsP/CotA-like multicopper oxidase with cupredoxin domain [Rhodobacter viridis]|uniref:FtsP/CotA-like multicopper oxidase with cupredoxin domain n=1 Tax=Rhodobacter viridis TaxID=1054202 RepID=A0A318TPW0_9RHOB|nr:multicopper oxidase family protein [Rhodobacter viridis]PYF06931.1 FtsP/CotA-like multicopper oxidase with cupredoxin domain [Rhodobacter viridis]